MKKIILFMSVLAISNYLMAQKEIKDENAQVRNLKGFTAISVSNAIDLYLTQADEEKVVVSASKEKYRDRIITVVENGVLKIRYENEDKWVTWDGNKKLKAYVSIKTIEKLKASGASDVYIEGTIVAKELTINISGASDLKGSIEATTLNIEQSGASDSQIKGKAVTLNIEVSGASDFKGYEFVSDYCNADASGSSDIKVTVNKELDAEASGSSDIYYKGNAVIKNSSTSGSSTIAKRG